MARITIPPNQDWRVVQLKELLEALDGLGYDGRGSWEIEFIENMKNMADAGQGPSDRQLEKLSEVYRRASI